MNLKSLVLISAVFSATIVNGQSFSITAGSGATLIGDTFEITGNSFTVDLWLNMDLATGSASTVSGALSFARNYTGASSGVGIGSAASVTSGPLSVAAATFGTQFSTTLATPLNSFKVRNAADTYAANYSTGPNDLPAVLYFARGNNPIVQLTGNIHLASVTFNSSLAFGDIYGDGSTESGLQLVNQTENAPGGLDLGSTGYSYGVSGQGWTSFRAGTNKYKVHAVPEPASMLVLAAGLAAIVRRSKNA